MTKGIPKVPAAVTLMRLHSRKAAVSAPATDMTEHAAARGERHQPHLGFDRERNVEGRKPEPEHSALPFSEDEKRHFSFPEDLSVVFSVRTQPVSVQLWLKLARLCTWGPAVGAPWPEAEEGRGTGRA